MFPSKHLLVPMFALTLSLGFPHPSQAQPYATQDECEKKETWKLTKRFTMDRDAINACIKELTAKNPDKPAKTVRGCTSAGSSHGYRRTIAEWKYMLGKSENNYTERLAEISGRCKTMFSYGKCDPGDNSVLLKKAGGVMLGPKNRVYYIPLDRKYCVTQVIFRANDQADLAGKGTGVEGVAQVMVGNNWWTGKIDIKMKGKTHEVAVGESSEWIKIVAASAPGAQNPRHFKVEWVEIRGH